MISIYPHQHNMSAEEKNMTDEYYAVIQDNRLVNEQYQ